MKTPIQGTAIITGASSGIGAVYAKKLARRGHDLVIVARDGDRLGALAKRLTEEHAVTVTPFPADLTNEGDLERVVARLSEDKTLSVLVNCAGLGPKTSALKSDDASLAAMVTLNVGVLHTLTTAAARAFAAKGHGAIINIASVAALIPERFNATYSAGKAFVIALTQGLASELTPQGVQIQAVLPGFTRTEIFDRAGFDINAIPAEMTMEAGEMVDAALAGFDSGELITIPSLSDVALWTRLEQARADLGPHLSLRHAAARYARTTGPD